MRIEKYLAAIEKGQWFIGVLILLSSLLAVIYIWRIVEVAYFKEAPKEKIVFKEAPVTMLVPMWLLTFASIYFGVDATRTIEIARTASAYLMKIAQ